MINYYVRYILKCAEISSDQNYTTHVSHDLFITEKSVKYIKKTLFFHCMSKSHDYNQNILDRIEILLKLIYKSCCLVNIKYVQTNTNKP